MSVDKSPVYNVKAIPVEKIQANDYNPNVVAPPEMKLLELSIWEDGFTMPCVCYYDREKDNYILVDGYHRYQVLKTSKRIYQRENGLSCNWYDSSLRWECLRLAASLWYSRPSIPLLSARIRC